MMNRNLLCIITVTKDDTAGLARTLSSAAGLRAAGAQHVVIDGGGDAVMTQNVVAQFEDGIRVYARTPQGIADAFNAGLAEARGGWVWFLNGGDAVHEDLDISWLLSLLRTTRADIVTGALHFDGEPTPRRMPSLEYQWPLIACWLGHPVTLVRREVMARIGGFDPKWKIVMDYDLWNRLLGRNTVIDVVSVPFARFEVNGMSERKDTRLIARREEAAVVLKYSWSMGCAVVRLGARLARRITWAICRWLRLSGRKSRSL
jgi:hypothetical protein